MDNQELDERIRKIVREEIEKSEWRMAGAICNPTLLKVLQSKFPGRQSDSQGAQTPPEP